MRILIATDGSSFSKAAIARACDFIVPESTAINIVSAVEQAESLTRFAFEPGANLRMKITTAKQHGDGGNGNGNGGRKNGKRRA